MSGGRHRGRAAFITALTLMVVASQAVVGIAPAYAATFNVDSTADDVDAAPGDGVCATGGAQCTLRAAIQEANALAGVDTINVPAGTYSLTIAGQVEDAAATGDLDITETLTIVGAGSGSTIIDGGALDRVFDVFGIMAVDISGVTIQNGSIDDGAAIYSANGASSITLTNVVVSGNTASDDGGGIFVLNASLDITDSTIDNNFAAFDGGGILATSSSVTLTRVTVSNNRANARDGGGLSYSTGTATIVNSTFSGNYAEDDGGGIRLGAASSADIRHSTITNNTAIAGGGYRGNGVTLENTIISGNTPDNCRGFPISNGYNVEDANSCFLAGPGDQPNTDPLLGPLANNGGPTQTHAIGAASPALDTGSPTCPATDQRGTARPQGASCDTGAFEALPAPFVVNSTGDAADLVPGNGSCDTGGLNSQGAVECTLRAAIQEANAYAGANTISFNIPTTEPGYSAAPLSYTIQPATALPSLTDPVTLDATTQPDFPGTPIIQLDGSLTVGGANGFLLLADNSTIRGFVINRFADEGVDLFAASGNTIAGNYIGTDVTGSGALANGDIGVLLNGASANNMVGGTGPGDRNVISGNTSSGVAIRNVGSDDNSVVGNYIGVNAAGTGPLGNGGHGVELTDSALNTIVGDPAGPPNVISANGQAGISLTTNATGAIIRGNLIGTDVTGLAGLGNAAEGVFADADNVTIGGPGAADGNVVSDNGIDGLRLERLNAIVQGNLIGTDATGSGPLGNTDDGIDTGSGTAGSLIGGLGANEPNTIAYSGDLGIAFRNIAGLSGAVLRNSIYGNGSLGIDLATNGITPNDPGDVDGGPNGLLNFPVITSAGEAGGTVIVDFDLDLAAGDYRVEFFDNPSGADPSGNGEGEVLVSWVNIAHTGSGVESFSHNFPGSTGDVITTTNTHCTNPGCTAFDATSEFSGAVTVILLNSRPVLDPIGPQSGDEGTLITFTATASDPDFDGLTFSLEGVPPPGASIDALSGVFSWTPSEAQGPGVYPVTVRVTDDGLPVLFDEEVVSITVNEVNVAPVLTPIGPQSGDEQTLITFTATATDADVPANGLTYSLPGVPPAGASIDPLSGVFTWTPSEAQGPGVYPVTVRVTDDGVPVLFDEEIVSVTVNENNQAPVLTPIGAQSGDEGTLITFTASASDADLPANGLTYSLEGSPPAGAVIDPVTGVFTWTPSEAQGPGVYLVTVRVTDDGVPSLFDEEIVSVTVNETNVAPTVGPIADQNIDELTLLSVGASASDADVPANTLTWSLVTGPAGALIDPVTGVFTWTPTEAQGPGAYLVTVRATDDGAPNLSDDESFTVTVAEINVAPILAAIGPQSGDEGTLITFNASAFDSDDPPNGLTFTLLPGAPAGAAIDPVTGVFTWTPTEAQGPGSYVVTVRVTDDGTPNLSDDESLAITVGEVNQPPVVNPIADQSTDEGFFVSLTPTASDPDTPANTLTWTATGLPVGLSIDPTMGEISGTVDYSAAAGSPYAVTITATDNGAPNLSGQTSFTWTVINNLNPVANPDTYNLTEGTSLTVPAPGVLTNDVDPENDPLTVSLVTGPTQGTLTLNPDGSFTYVHGASDATDDSFIYQLSDGNGNFAAGVVTLEIDSANLAPTAVDDSVTLDEDTPIEVLVTTNDIDPDGDPLSVTSVTQPAQGAAVITGPGSVRYVPPPDYWGTTAFTYTVSDGRGGEATATVNVVVLPVNDVPLALGEEFALTSYVTAEFNVLNNDWDPDGDPLVVLIGDAPSAGQVSTDGRLIFFTPESGWVGTVTFTYLAMDPSGARDAATVSVTVSQAVLIGAEQLAEQLGVAALPFESPPPVFDPTTLVMAPTASITLIADAFYQSVQALRLPLSFLGLALLMLVGLGTATRVPFLLAGARHRFWAVVLLDREQVLPAYSEPGGTKVIYNFDPTMSGIVSTGKPRRVGVSQWLPVDTPNGEGWVDRQYLTEQVDLQAFMSDPRPAELVDRLASRLETGRDLTSLIAGRGLVVALTGPPTRIPPERLEGLLGESQLRRLHTVAGALDAEDDFRVAVAEPFLEAYEASGAVSAQTPHSRTSLIPTELWNFPYLALGDEQGVQPWLVFFEYRRRTAWITALGIDE